MRLRCMRTRVGCLAVIVLTACAAHTSAPVSERQPVAKQSSMTPGSPLAVPWPPPQPCRLPGRAADLDALRAGSDLVVLGQLSSERAVQTGNSVLQTSVLTIKRTLEARDSAKRLKVTVVTNGPADHAINPAGTYLMFLRNEGPSYSVTEGFMGALPVESDGYVRQRCPDATGGGQRTYAANPDGTTATVLTDTFARWVGQRARPARAGR